MGVKAADLALEGASGLMVALQGTEIVTVDLAAACSQPRLVPSAICELARWFTV
jgi:6-phosphofructokinase